MSIDQSKLSKIRSSATFKYNQEESVLLQEDELAKRGKDVDACVDTLKLIHSPKTAPTVETSLKFSKSKNSNTIKQNMDEGNLHEKISKLKSYYKSAQGLIADELSHEARIKKQDRQSNELTRCFSEQKEYNHAHSGSMPLQFAMSQSSLEPPRPIKEDTVNIFGSFNNKFFESQNHILQQENLIDLDISASPKQGLPAIVENKSSNRTSLKGGRLSGQMKEMLKRNLKNKTVHHKFIIDRYFCKKGHNLQA